MPYHHSIITVLYRCTNVQTRFYLELRLLLDDHDGGIGYVLLGQEVLAAGAVHAAGVLQDRLLDVHEELGQVHRVQADCHPADAAAPVTRVLNVLIHIRYKINISLIRFMCS